MRTVPAPPGGGESCPSTADSSAVSLSQMAFLSMAVSIFRFGMADRKLCHTGKDPMQIHLFSKVTVTLDPMV